MKEYHVSGELMKGFLGTITYETVLPKNINEVSIRVSFGKREMETCTDMDRQLCREAWIQNMESEPDDSIIDGLIRGQKTEINVSVFHNGAHLGCAHRDEMTKEIILSPTYASPGFSIWKPEAGDFHPFQKGYRKILLLNGLSGLLVAGTSVVIG